MEKEIPSGCLTAIVTPFKSDGSIDWQGLEKNIEFQIAQGVKGIIPVGTTGESPSLTPEEHKFVLARASEFVRGRIFVLAGAGSNSTQEALEYSEAAEKDGCNGILLVDCYYNGPSSLELREEYYRPIAERFKNLVIVPYIIPGRTGCALEPGDLAVLAWQYPNISAVKEARGDFEKMKETRRLVPENFKIISGDDDKTFQTMTDPEIKASGVISVISNIAPGIVQQMSQKILEGKTEEAKRIKEALDPLFKMVTVTGPEIKRVERLGGREVVILDKFRNPVGIKIMMAGLGIPAGIPRRPLGKITKVAVEKVRNALKEVWEKNPWILRPIAEFYDVDIRERLANDRTWEKFYFEESKKNGEQN